VVAEVTGHPRTLLVALLLAGAMLLAGCAPAKPTASDGSASPSPARDSLAPTVDDGLSPSYKPDAPSRSVVGSGHVLTGTVVSSLDGTPIAGAKLELWPEYAGRGHPDEARATVFTGPSGGYRFTCDPPEHIHMKITADGYIGIAQNSYHPDGRSEGTFDIVLQPE